MARNRIQFQRGLSLPQFNALYASEEQCEAALEKARWPDGFRILASRPWTAPQRQWLQRIANQTKAITIVDREALDDDALLFRREGGGMTLFSMASSRSIPSSRPTSRMGTSNGGNV